MILHNRSCTTPVVDINARDMPALDPHTLDLATLAWLAGVSANARLLRTVRGSKHPNVRTTHGYVFQHLLGSPLTVGELAEVMGVTQQAASKLVAELETSGYVERRADAADKRVRRLFLTRRGAAVLARGRAARAKLEAKLRAAVGDQALDGARSVLVALLDLSGGREAVVARRVLPRS